MKFHTFDLICTQRVRFARDFFLFSFRKAFTSWKLQKTCMFALFILNRLQIYVEKRKTCPTDSNVKVARNKQRQQIDQPLLLRATLPTPHTETKNPRKVKLTTGRECFCSSPSDPTHYSCKHSDNIAYVPLKTDLNPPTSFDSHRKAIPMSDFSERWLNCFLVYYLSFIYKSQLSEKSATNNLKLQNFFVFLWVRIPQEFSRPNHEKILLSNLSAPLSRTFIPTTTFSLAGKAGAGRKHVEKSRIEKNKETLVFWWKKNLFGKK